MEAVRGEWAPVIVVDDVREDLLLAERVLRQHQILNPIGACLGGDAFIELLDKTLRLEKSRWPALVLLDLIMSPTSGLAVLRAMKANGCIKDIPVVMLSGIRDIQAIRDGYQLGAQTFLIKPITSENIVQLLDGIKRLRIEERPNGYALYVRSAEVSPVVSAEFETSFLNKTAAIPG